MFWSLMKVCVDGAHVPLRMVVYRVFPTSKENLSGLGTKLKNSCCGTTGIVVGIEVQRDKKLMKFSKYNSQFDHYTGSSEGVKNFEIFCDKPLDHMSCTGGPIIRTEEFHQQCKISNKQLVIGDSFSSSIQAATESMRKHGRHYLGVVK